AQEFQKRTGIRCSLVSNFDDAGLDRDLATAVFRIVQEALTNVARHAEARNVSVTLERRREALEVDVRDDGKGIRPEEITSPASLGLLGLRERARRFGGTVAVGAGSPRGTQVLLTVPLAPI